MKINHVNTINHTQRRTPAFGSIKICQGAVLKSLADGTKQRIPVEFHLLNADDIVDIERIAPKWNAERPFGDYIMSLFLDFAEFPTPYSKHKYGVNFFALKPANPADFGSKEPLGFVITTRYLNDLTNAECTKINYLQSSEKYRNGKIRQISGCGEMLLYGVSKLVKQMKHKVLRFETTEESNDFYQKALHPKKGSVYEFFYTIQPKTLDTFISRTEEKYGILKGEEIAQTTLDEIDKHSYLVECC